MNDILQSFIEQTYGSLDKARQADKLADLNPHAQPEHDHYFDDRGNQELEKKANEEAQKQAMKGHFENKPIKESMFIPTKLQNESLNQKTQPHDNFKNYDHQLEINRAQKLGLIRLRDMPTGDVDTLYDNMFDDNSNLVE